MQQQSIQYHIDAIRNILSLESKLTKHTHRHLLQPDSYESHQKSIKGEKQLEINYIPGTVIYSIITLTILMVDAIIPMSIYTHLAKMLYVPTCLYTLWVNYSLIHAINTQQKIILLRHIFLTQIMLYGMMPLEIYEEFHPSHTYIYLIAITSFIGTFNIIHFFVKEKINKDKNNIRFIENNLFNLHENISTPSEETLTNEYIQHMIHELGDIIIIGQKSSIHAILTERYKKLPHNRTILEKHLHHLSCQVPLIYLTPSGNYIPKKLPTTT